MAEPDGVSGVYSGFGGVFERDYGDARGHSRPRSFHAQPGGEKCDGSEPITAVKGTGVAGGGPGVQRFADQPGGATDAAAGDADEGVPTGARGAEFGTEAAGDSLAGKKYP